MTCTSSRRDPEAIKLARLICPVAGAREAMETFAPALAANPLVFPTDDMLAKSFEFMPLDETQERRYQQEFAEAIGG